MTRSTLLIMNAVFLIAAVLAWPIYQSASFSLLVASGLVLANGLVLVGLWRKLSPLTLSLITAAVFIVVGVPLAIPSGLASPAAFVQAFVSLFPSIVTSWKDLLTLSLPVGSYQAVLVPALVMFFVVPVTVLNTALTAKRIWPLAAGFAALPMVFAATFGSSATSEPLTVFGLNLPAPVEIGLTVLSVLLLMLWLSKRRTRRRVSGATQRRIAPAGLTIAAGVVVALVLAPALMQLTPREVLRTQIDPRLQIDQQLSPLSLYRASFSNELVNTTLFQVSGAQVDRVRLATLSGFDGQVATVSAGDAGTSVTDSGTFARVPSLLRETNDDASVSIRIEALRGIWMPTVADLDAVSFSGERRIALTDGFFYNGEQEAGIQLADGGLRTGDTVRLTASPSLNSSATGAVSLAELKPGLTQPRIDPALVPESLQDWIALQRVSRTGQGLETLIERLRARGYLSHSLSIDAANPPIWMLELPGYRFEPSRAGHSSARIDQLFTQLRDRQRELGDASDAELVAAVGDDEQFVVAAMLLADQLGFNARIALGTALQRSGDAANSAVAVCDSGACTGANLTAWLEVQGDSGAWVAVDVTPQFENPIAPDRDRLQDPQVPTEVQPPSVESVQPPESEPSQRDADSSDPDANPLNLAWLWLTLQVIGVLLLIALILFGPLLAIVLLKASRRANRRRSLEPKDSVLGAWNEFVDTAVDAGSAPPRNETRSEFVERQPRAEDNTELLSLAQLADRAVFSAELSSTQQRDQAWHIVDEHRAVSRAALNRRQRLLAILSLRSFLRFLRGGYS